MMAAGVASVTESQHGDACQRDLHADELGALGLPVLGILISGSDRHSKSSYPVACPHKNCGWAGSLVPSRVRGGAGEEIVSMQRAWFRCRGDWEVRSTNDRATVVPGLKQRG
jgi:hypothetical protein